MRGMENPRFCILGSCLPGVGHARVALREHASLGLVGFAGWQPESEPVGASESKVRFRAEFVVCFFWAVAFREGHVCVVLRTHVSQRGGDLVRLRDRDKYRLARACKLSIVHALEGRNAPSYETDFPESQEDYIRVRKIRVRMA